MMHTHTYGDKKNFVMNVPSDTPRDTNRPARATVAPDYGLKAEG